MEFFSLKKYFGNFLIQASLFNRQFGYDSGEFFQIKSILVDKLHSLATKEKLKIYNFLIFSRLSKSQSYRKDCNHNKSPAITLELFSKYHTLKTNLCQIYIPTNVLISLRTAPIFLETLRPF